MPAILALVVFIVVLGIVGAVGWYVIKKFELPQPALWIFGLLLLLALIFYVFGGYGNRAVVVM